MYCGGMAKIQTSCTVEPEVHERIKLVALVDRRSVADVVAECVRRALPQLEAELERPRLTAAMKRRIEEGEPVAEVIMQHLAPYATAPAPEKAAPAPPKRKAA